MRKLSVGHQEVFLDWAGNRVGTDKWPPESEAMAVLDGTDIKAVMVINARYGDQCHLHFATDGSKSWATPNILGGLLGYVFILKKIKRANVVVERDNIAVQVMLIKLGFRFEGNLRRGSHDGSDAILLCMLHDECKWIKQGAPDHG